MASASRTVASRIATSGLVIAEQKRLLRLWRRTRKAEMHIGLPGQHAATRRALHQALLDQIGLDDFLDSIARFAERRRQSLDAHRPAIEAFSDQREIAPVEGVESALVDLQPRERGVGHDLIDLDASRDGGEITYALQQPAGNARRAARAHGDLMGAVRAERQAEHARTAR